MKPKDRIPTSVHFENQSKLIRKKKMSKIILFIVLLLSLVNDSKQQFGLIDSVSDLINLYDGVDCSMKIVDIYFVQFRQPLCCIYWKFQQFFQHEANNNCDKPENVRKILSGEMLQDYVDFSHLDCGGDSFDCSRFWSLLVTIFLSQLICLLLFFITTVILVVKLCRNYSNNKSPPSSALVNISRNSSEATSLLTTSTIIADSDTNSNNSDDDFLSCHHHSSSMISMTSSGYSI